MTREKSEKVQKLHRHFTGFGRVRLALALAGFWGSPAAGGSFLVGFGIATILTKITIPKTRKKLPPAAGGLGFGSFLYGLWKGPKLVKTP